VVVALDLKHSRSEPRFIALGRTDGGRRLTIVFTIRGPRIRVISARPMSKAERTVMAKSKPALKALPEFSTEADERRFWETHDSTDYVDWSAAIPLRFPNVKPSTETISLRLPAGLLADLKGLANRQDVPYQSLLKVFLAERVAREWRAVDARGTSSKKSERSADRPRRKAKSPKRTHTLRG
jgi:predicted DNA binding CopG/RHH family protein